ncbi:MAG: hypothetical protein QM774_05175 [Gordonia sp. (in: high G+C Gram-positive bacteria)]|uniref:hypothetical protein n=1 Tax=Gordonia sp. (in: high G+C Gram-positive bacteria) TaxID=84139 RepID=UPI0039E24FD8
MTGPESTPPPPSPAAAAAQAARAADGPGDPADHPVLAQVRALLDEAAQIRQATDGEFDLDALSRQSELLTAAHDALAAALEDAGRG